MSDKKQSSKLSLPLSERLFAEAQLHIPGGVNSPVRAFKAVGGTPPFIVRAKGSRLHDADGREYIDYVGSWGPAILGHADSHVLAALHGAMKNGLSFGAPTTGEIELARAVKKHVPSVELIRFVNSGTEATMSAIRVARGFTDRDKIIKFDGHYHGHADFLLVKAGSGAATCGSPDSAGVPASFAEHTLTAPFNNLDVVSKIFDVHRNQIACVIVEPIMGNMGCILPQNGFLKGLRDLCDTHKAVLIFDEVMTGFRVGMGGAQGLYGLRPDLSTFGKIIGGGLPVGAYGGRRDIMGCVAPLGKVYQAGTLSGNPLAMAVGLKTLELLARPNIYETLENLGQQLEEGLRQAASEHNIPVQINRVGSMFSFFFSEKPVTDAESARLANRKLFNRVFHHMLANGVYLAPSAFEAGFISLAHTPEDIKNTVQIFSQAFR